MNNAKNFPGEYWSCEWLESGILFGAAGVHGCCVGHHENRGWPLLLPGYQGGELPVETILEARRAIVEANQRPEHHPSCEGCGALVRRKWKPRKYSFDIVGISHFTKCNVKCYYCYTLKEGFRHVEKPFKLLPVLEKMFAEGHLDPKGQSHWGGGEPTTLREFNPMFTLLASKGHFQFLNTNAVILSKTVLDWLPRIGAQVTVSIDAASRETYRKIKGVDAFDRVWRNVAEYAAAGGERVVCKMVINKYNYHEVIPFMDLVEKAGIRRVIADVDAWEPALQEEIVAAGSRMAYECSLRGMVFLFLAPGSVAYPENQWGIKVFEGWQTMMRAMPFFTRARVFMRSPSRLKRLAKYVLRRTGF